MLNLVKRTLVLGLFLAACSDPMAPPFPPGFTVTAIVQPQAVGQACGIGWSATASDPQPNVHYVFRVTESHSFLVTDRRGTFRNAIQQSVSFQPSGDTLTYPLTVSWWWGENTGPADTWGVWGEGQTRVGAGCVLLP